MPQVMKSSKKMNFVDQAYNKHGTNCHGNNYGYNYDRAGEEKVSFKVKEPKGPRYNVENLN